MENNNKIQDNCKSLQTCVSVTVADLRIGNLILDKDNEINEVIGIVNGALFLKDKYEFVGCPASWCKPIPLTEEWLLKYGFDKPAHSWNGKIFHLSEWDDYPLNWCVAMNKNNAIIFEKLKYVHQLQNLHYILGSSRLQISSITEH